MNTVEEYKIIGDYLCVQMPKEIDHHNAESISEKIDQFIVKRNVNHVLFDFSETEFMDSSGIGILVGRYKKVACFQGKIYLVHMNAQIKKILSVSGIAKYMEILEER